MGQEGSLHITIHEEQTGSKPPAYAVTFAPFAGEGGAVPARICRGEQELTGLLADAGIQRYAQVDALKQLRDTRRAQLHVIFAGEDRRRLSL